MINNSQKKINLKQIIQQEKLVLIDFFASWCIPCQKIMPVLEKISQIKPEISLIKIDTDIYPDLTEEYKIKSFPTLILYKNNREVDKRIGYQSFEEILSFLKKHQ